MIRCERLTKWYGATRALTDVSFEVRPGEIVGLLGPNGAGKSTTMKILTGYVAASGGRAEVAGHPAGSVAARRRIGYLPEDTPLYRDMTVLGYLRYVAALRRVPRARLARVAEATGIAGVAGQRIGELSKGYRQRVGLAQAMVHEPEILVLDEPTSGLDPNQIVEIRALIQELGRAKTVILSTHILSEVQATCDRVVIVAGGRVVADAAPRELVAAGAAVVAIVLDAGAPGDAELEEAVRAVAGVREVLVRSAGEGREIRVTSDAGVDLRRELFAVAVARGWPVLELARREASLEEAFGRVTGGDA